MKNGEPMIEIIRFLTRTPKSIILHAMHCRNRFLVVNPTRFAVENFNYLFCIDIKTMKVDTPTAMSFNSNKSIICSNPATPMLHQYTTPDHNKYIFRKATQYMQ